MQLLLGRLTRLPERHRLAFALACASRLAKPYDAVREQGSLGGPDLTQVLLPALWDFASGGPAADWISWAESIGQSLPTSEDEAAAKHFVFNDTLAAAAYALDTATSFEPQNAAWAANLAYDVANAFAQEKLDFETYTPTIEAALLNDPTVQEELGRQARDLADLEADPSGHAVDVTRRRALVESALPVVQLLASTPRTE